MSPRLRLATGLVCSLTVLAPSAGATVSSPPTRKQARAAIRGAERAHQLWATVNICNTHKHPDMVGIRAQMPALGFRAALTMVIEAQYWSGTDQRFEPDPYADRNVWLGHPSSGLHQAGVTFSFSPPVFLRAVVTFSWKHDGKVLATVKRKTSRGASQVDFGDPPGYSRATCRIK